MDLSTTKIGTTNRYGLINKTTAMSRLEKYYNTSNKKESEGKTEPLDQKDVKISSNINTPVARLQSQYKAVYGNPVPPSSSSARREIPTQNVSSLKPADTNINSTSNLNKPQPRYHEQNKQPGGIGLHGSVDKTFLRQSKYEVGAAVKAKSGTNINEAGIKLRPQYKGKNLRPSSSAVQKFIDTNNNSTVSNKPEELKNEQRVKDASPKKMESLREKATKCVCNRPKSYILCTICGYTTFGRIRTPCCAHLRLTYLLDMVYCPRCNSAYLMEVSSQP